MSATAGKVALVSNQTTLTGTCPLVFVDFVGFGTTANCFEGSGPTPATSNTTSAQRKTPGIDTNNNNSDFAIGAPSPTNGGADVTPPTITALYPAHNATAIIPPFTASVQFNESILKGAGNIVLKQIDGTVIQTIALGSVTISGSLAQFEISTLDLNKEYYFEIAGGTFTDAARNAFAGITESNTWKFNTIPIPGIHEKLYDFNICSTTLPDGFSQYSVAGAQKWGCTNFGIDAALSATGSAIYGLQMNGYASGNVFNQDWLISPAFDLTNTQFPLYSFWSRTAFTGAPLELKISTDYTGTGDPNTATWTDLDGKFPGQISDVWTLSENIDLSAFKTAGVYVAFVYNSTTEDGARWTLDNIRMMNSATPPPPSLKVSTAGILFPFVSAGAYADKSFVLNAYDVTTDVVLNTAGAFLISKSGTDFSSSILLTAEEINKIPKQIFVRFSPTQNNLNFSGFVEISSGEATVIVELNGTTVDPATTLEVVNYNIEWFGSPTLGPANDALQEQNVTSVLQNLNADIYGLLEVVDETRLARVVGNLSGYSYVISNFGSHTNTSINPITALDGAQKLAFVYKTEMFSNISTSALLSVGINSAADVTNPDYYNWSSGRFPFMMSADVTLNCVTKNVKFVLVHAKANTAPVLTSYDRRKKGADNLYAHLNETFPNDNIIILGDFNDDLDQSITAGKTITSWNSFISDVTNYVPLTLPLSLAGKKSTVSYNDVIDHVVVSNEIAPFYMPASASILTDVTVLIPNYAKTTTDHYPVFTRYMIPNTTAPVIAECTPEIAFCKADGTFAIPAFMATDDCDQVAYTFNISGATSRSGSTNNASGPFSLGTSLITWTASDNWGNSTSCTTVVVVNDVPEVTVPDVYAMPNGVDMNTVYIGYSPAAALTLEAVANDVANNFIYEWRVGNTFFSNMKTIVVSPIMPETYTVTVTNANGCSSLFSKTIQVVNVRGGNKLDKVTICHPANKQLNTLVVSSDAVPALLARGDRLGSCAVELAQSTKSATIDPDLTDLFKVQTYPNPSASNFTIRIESSNSAENITMRITNVLGVTVEQKSKIQLNSMLQIGGNYPSGFYFVEIVQGKNRIVQKLIKN